MKKQNGCSCDKCIKCCSNSCGWFGSIEEVKGASKIMKMKLADFAKEYLIEEWWYGDGVDISVIAPRKNFEKSKNLLIFEEDKQRNNKGFVKATWGHNLITGVPCIFLDENNKCIIHESKPQECRENFGCDNKKPITTRPEIAKYWKRHKTFIMNLKKRITNENDK